MPATTRARFFAQTTLYAAFIFRAETSRTTLHWLTEQEWEDMVLFDGDEMTIVGSPDELEALDNKALLMVFNAETRSELTRFRDRQTALRKVWEMLEEKAPAMQASLEADLAGEIVGEAPETEQDAPETEYEVEAPDTEATPAEVDVVAIREELGQITRDLQNAKAQYEALQAALTPRREELRGLLKIAKSLPKVRKEAGPSDVVVTLTGLLSREQGASKAECLAACPDSKAGYITALLNRVLKEKGYAVEGRWIGEGKERERRYFLAAGQAGEGVSA